MASLNGARVKADDTQRNQIVGEYIEPSPKQQQSQCIYSESPRDFNIKSMFGYFSLNTSSVRSISIGIF